MHERIFIGGKGRSLFSAGDRRDSGAALGWQPPDIAITFRNRRFARSSPRAPERAAVCCCAWHLLVGVMADALFSSAEAKAQLASGVVAKLVKAAEASSLLTVTAQGTVVGVQWRRVAEAADLGAAEMGALRDWIEEIHSKEAADRFSSSLPPVSVTVKEELPAAALAPAASSWTG